MLSGKVKTVGYPLIPGLRRYARQRNTSLASLKALIDKPQVLPAWFKPRPEYATREEEWAPQPEYPPLTDFTPTGRERQTRQLWYDKVRDLPTVQEKQLEIMTVASYPYLFDLEPMPVRYNILPFYEFCTRTRFVRSLPSEYDYTALQRTEPLYEELKSCFHNAIKDAFVRSPVIDTELSGAPIPEENLHKQRAEQCILELYRLVVSQLQKERNDVGQYQTDYYPRHESFWWCGGFRPDKDTRDKRKDPKNKLHTPELEPIDRYFSYKGSPCIQMRADTPLQCFVPRDHPLCTTAFSSDYNFDPRMLGFPFDKKYGCNVPGCWPSDTHSFPHTSVHYLNNLPAIEKAFGSDETVPSVNAAGIMAGFGVLHASAMLQGFTMMQDITYPISCQTILTDGRRWYFFVSQLNTITLGMDFAPQQYSNVCWSSGEMQLFNKIENGEIIGINDEVLRLFTAFCARRVAVPADVTNLKPLLGETKLDEDTWDFLVEKYHDVCANRPVHKQPCPVHLWEEIYKYKFRTRLFLNDHPDFKY